MISVEAKVDTIEVQEYLNSFFDKVLLDEVENKTLLDKGDYEPLRCILFSDSIRVYFSRKVNGIEDRRAWKIDDS